MYLPPYWRYDPSDREAADAHAGRQHRRSTRPRRATAGCRPAGGVDAAGRRYPAVARRPGRPRLPGFRVRPAAGARDRHRRAGGSAHAGAAPGRRGADPGPVRDGDPARLDAAGRRGRCRAGGPGPAQAAAARGPSPDRGRPGGARAAAGRLVRRGDRGRVRRGADPGPSDLGRVHDGRSACHTRRRGVRRQRSRRGAAGPRPGAGRDGASGLPAGGAHRRRGGAARPEVREPGPGGEPGAAADRRADPADGRGSDAGPGVVRRGPEPVRGRGQAGHRRERPPLPRAAGRRLRVVSAAAKCARPTPSRC
jgi:hypothetical protein